MTCMIKFWNYNNFYISSSVSFYLFSNNYILGLLVSIIFFKYNFIYFGMSISGSNFPACVDLKTYPVKVENDKVYIKIS